MAIETNKILKEHLIICEGLDALNFIISMLNSPLFSNDRRISDSFQVLDFGGVDDLSKFLGLLPLREGFSEVKSLLVIRDAESNVETACNSIKRGLKNNGFAVPDKAGEWKNGSPKVAYLLFPELNTSAQIGALEDLCTTLILEQNKDDIICEINDFLRLMEENHGFHHPRLFKNTLHTYFSAKDKFVSMKIGEAANANAFDWSSSKLDILRELLTEALDS